MKRNDEQLGRPDVSVEQHGTSTADSSTSSKLDVRIHCRSMVLFEFVRARHLNIF